jgi:hypothetical protein
MIGERREALDRMLAQARRGDPRRRVARAVFAHADHDEQAHAGVLARRMLMRRGACEHPAWRAFLSAFAAVGLDQPGRYAAFVLKPIHNIWVYLMMLRPRWSGIDSSRRYQLGFLVTCQ